MLAHRLRRAGKNFPHDLDHAPFIGGLSSEVLNVVYLCAKLDNSSFSRSCDIIGEPKISNTSHDPDHGLLECDLSTVCCYLT